VVVVVVVVVVVQLIRNTIKVKREVPIPFDFKYFV
jgi:hypothetical protein